MVISVIMSAKLLLLFLFLLPYNARASEEIDKPKQEALRLVVKSEDIIKPQTPNSQQPILSTLVAKAKESRIPPWRRSRNPFLFQDRRQSEVSYTCCKIE